MYTLSMKYIICIVVISPVQFCLGVLAIHQLRMNRLSTKASYQACIGRITSLQSVHIVVVGRRRLNIYFYHVQDGQRNVSIISVTALTSKMYFRTMSSSLHGICLPLYRHCLTGSSQQQQHYKSDIIRAVFVQVGLVPTMLEVLAEDRSSLLALPAELPHLMQVFTTKYVSASSIYLQ